MAPRREQILRLATAFREAIEDALKAGDLPLVAEDGEFFNGFPRGACGPASVLLAAFLAENGVSSPSVVNGGTSPEDFHTWVQAEGFAIDVTGDQFPGVPSTVVAGDGVPSPFALHNRLRKGGSLVSGRTALAKKHADFAACYEAIERHL